MSPGRKILTMMRMMTMSDGVLIFIICVGVFFFVIFALPSVGGGRVPDMLVVPPPPKRNVIVDRFGLPMVYSGAKMPSVKPPKKPFADAVMPDKPWPRGGCYQPMCAPKPSTPPPGP